MTFEAYCSCFEQILNNESPQAPYDNPDYFEYAKLNWSRMNRWLKKGELNGSFVTTVKAIVQSQHWIVITEPWCGDAAHSVPFIELASRINPLITLDYELRDSAPFRIDGYLTNGGKSIPKLIIRDKKEADLGVWGPRPVACQQYFDQLKAEGADFETQKTALQKWYNADKGEMIQQELQELLSRMK